MENQIKNMMKMKLIKSKEERVCYIVWNLFAVFTPYAHKYKLGNYKFSTPHPYKLQ